MTAPSDETDTRVTPSSICPALTVCGAPLPITSTALFGKTPTRVTPCPSARAPGEHSARAAAKGAAAANLLQYFQRLRSSRYMIGAYEIFVGIMRPVAIFRHAAGDGPGYFSTHLTRRNLAYRLICVDRGEEVPAEPAGFSGIALMGGPMSVN